MTSNTPTSADTSQSRERETSISSPHDHRTTSSTFSNPKGRYSYASSETGESSTAASNRSSLQPDHGVDKETHESLNSGALRVDGRGSHRSHRSRNSGGFLLLSSTFDPPIARSPPTAKDASPQPRSTSDKKGKSMIKTPESRHKQRKSNLGLGLGGSPLAGNVTTIPTDLGQNVPASLVKDAADGAAQGEERKEDSKGVHPPLDVDSAQIVSLALNLSESRRNAARRVVSTPLPPPVAGFADSMAGGSMRYYMQQQQRRPSRNISPKPDRGEKGLGPLPRVASGRLSSPLQPGFDLQSDGAYQYHFSASTLARAEKTRKAIELMAQYRQLLQYIPPLKPHVLERSTTANTIPGTPTSSTLSPYRTISRTAAQPLGRQYNPLQYIRNRKVRARNAKSIDGEAQGFGDVVMVTSWVARISEEASSGYFQSADALILPPLNLDEDPLTVQQTSPQSTTGRNSTTVKVKRPRIDWVTNPADMIADIYWLEQNDNKKLIEDRQGRRIFPVDIELKRPISRRGEEDIEGKDGVFQSPTKGKSPVAGHHDDHKLPEFKSIKPDQLFHDSSTSKAKQKLRDVRKAARLHHGHSGSGHDIRDFLRSRSKSESSSSDSDTDHGPRRRRSDTTDSHDRGKDILEKQMAEMLAKETQKPDSGPRDIEGQRIIKSIETQKPLLRDDREESRKGTASHSRSASLATRSKRASIPTGSSGRASLEVPGTNPRTSLEELDTTAPNSPEWKARKSSNSHVPSIAMDLTSPRSRHSSPSRRAMSKVRSRLTQSHERHSQSDKTTDDEGRILAKTTTKDSRAGASSPERRRLSISPSKKMSRGQTDEPHRPKKTGSLRRGKTDDSGIRGFLKNARNPVTRVSDLLWKKDSSSGHRNASAASTDDSDSDARPPRTKGSKESSRDSSGTGKFDDLDKAWPRKEQPSYLNDMPTFTSPFERRGRPTESRNEDTSKSENLETEEHAAREKRRKSSRAQILNQNPRIDIHSPASSPEDVASERGRRPSSVTFSDLDSRRSSNVNGVRRADSRLNAVLGFPGKGHIDGLPMTGLASLETSNRRPSMADQRHWSISDREVSVRRGPTNRREIARVRALLLSSGIKAKEISRRAAEAKDFSKTEDSFYKDIAALSKEKLAPIPKGHEHIVAARILSNDIQLSTKMWQESADAFCNTSVSSLLSSIENLQSRLVDTLTPQCRQAADEADEVSKDLVTSQTLNVKRISDQIDKMIRTRRRRFRWLRRGGWVLVEWALVGVMWYVWFMVMLLRVVMGVGKGVVGSVRWLLFL